MEIYLDASSTTIPHFSSMGDGIIWIKKFSGIKLWHATRLLNHELNLVLEKGLNLPEKSLLDAKLISWLQSEKSWYNHEVDRIIDLQDYETGEAPAIYTVISKEDCYTQWAGHYAQYGSEYWQYLLGKLSGLGFGEGRKELLSYGSRCLVELRVKWESLDPQEVEYIAKALFENETYNCSVAIYRDVMSDEIHSVKKI